MGRNSEHTGFTATRNTRERRVEKIGRVTIYKRGRAYYVYYREGGKSVRRKVDGNLVAARAAASRINATLEEGTPSPFGFTPITIEALVQEYLGYCEEIQGLALRTLDRYRAALEHFVRFSCIQAKAARADRVTDATVQDFVRWLRQQPRARNGAKKGKQDRYTPSGVRFVLGACRTAFNWAGKRRYLPPYAENPFTVLPIDRMFKSERTQVRLLTPEEERKFFDSCDEWQTPIFFVLATYGLRVGELTHLLVSDVSLEDAVFKVRSKPEMYWEVKTGRERDLPLPQEMLPVFDHLIGDRKEGFLFVNKPFFLGEQKPAETFTSARALSARLQGLAQEAQGGEVLGRRAVKRRVSEHLRHLGQIPEKRVRQEFMKITTKIGCPEVTRVHSLRHLFSTRAQEKGENPLLVQGILGHTTLGMTSQYTHFGIESVREAMTRMLENDPVLREALSGVPGYVVDTVTP